MIAMCSVGLSLIFGTTGLTNFAHGEMVTFGAMVAYFLNDRGVHILHRGADRHGRRRHVRLGARTDLGFAACANVGSV